MDGIKIDTDTVRELVAKSIMDAIGEDQRDLIVTQAVTMLLEQPDAGYGRKGDSPLQLAFNVEVRKIAGDVVSDYLNSEEFRPIVEAKIRTVVEEFVTSNNWHLDAIAQAFGDRLGAILREGSDSRRL